MADETIELRAVERGKKQVGGGKMRREIQRVMENEREADGGGLGRLSEHHLMDYLLKCCIGLQSSLAPI